MRKVASLLVLALVAGLSTAAPALAQAKPGDFTLSPTSGPPGRVITATGKDKCVPKTGSVNPHVFVQLHEQNKGATLASNTFPVNAKGEWSGSLTVPSTATQGTKEIDATCRTGNASPVAYFVYGAKKFVVTAPAAPAPPKPSTFALSPTSGPPGRVLTISSGNDKCVPAGGAQNPHVLVQLYEQNKSALLAANNFPVNARGEWSGSLTVPATVPQGTKEVSAICRSGTGTPTQYKTYAVSQFLVTAPAFKFARLAGANRFETAATTAQNTFPTGAATAVIALGTNFPDALAGNYIAGERIAPILLVQPTTVPQGTLAGLRALKTQTVILLGGTAAISQGVEDQLKATDSTSSGSGKLSVTRIGGVNRYATARLVAESGGTAPVGSIDGKRTAIMGSGASFADVLAAGPLSYRLKLPTLLTEVTRLSAETRQALTNLQIAHVVIAGGTTVVTQAVENEIKAMGINVTRLAGTNRTDTAGRIAAYAVAKGGFVTTKANLARGDDYADALAGGPNAGNEGAVILLTAANNVLSPETRAYLVSQAGRITSGKIFGGTSAITNQVQAEAEAAATK